MCERHAGDCFEQMISSENTCDVHTFVDNVRFLNECGLCQSFSSVLRFKNEKLLKLGVVDFRFIYHGLKRGSVLFD